MRKRIALVLILAGCEKGTSFEAATTEMSRPALAGAEVGAAIGEGTVTIPVRMLNSLGIPSGGGTATVVLEGLGLSSSSANVEFDSWGWAEVPVSSALPQRVTARVTASSDGTPGGEADSYITSPLTDQPSLYPGFHLDFVPDRVEAVEIGFILQAGPEFYWMPSTPGSLPVRFASLPETPAGWITADIDEDGLADIAMWWGQEVHLLRGRSGGGYGWQAGFTLESTVRGVAVGRVDEQLSRDIVIAYSDDEEGGFQPLSGDGAWGFTPTAPRTFELDLMAITAGDWDYDGQDELALMSMNEDGFGEVTRYASSAEGWFPTGYELAGYDLDVPLREGSGFAPNGDINADGYDELILVGSPSEGNRQPLAFYTFDEQTTLFQFAYDSYALTVEDLSGDGAEELVLVESDENVLRLITADTDDGSMKNRSAGLMEPPAALAAADIDGEGLLDLITAADFLRVFPGEQDDTLNGRWTFQDEGLNLFALASSEVLHVFELDGDSQPEVLTVRVVSNTTVLQLLNVSTTDGAITIGGDAGDRVSVDEGAGGAAQGLDLAICDDVAYVLVDDGAHWLYAINIVDSSTVELRASVAVEATAIACGELDGGAVAALTGSQALLYDADLNQVGSAAVASTTVDIAIANTDGANALYTCETTGCSLLAVDLDGDGVQELVESGESATLSAWGESLPLGLGGEPSALDYDGDGRVDLLLTDTALGSVAVLRTLDEAIAPPLMLHTRYAVGGPAMAGDVDGDGIQELFFAEPEGGLYFTKPSTE